MAIYETNSHHCLSNNKNHSSSNGGGATCFVLKAAMALVFAGPKQLLPNVRRDPYALLNSSDDHWMATLQASISLTLWCLGLIAAVSGKGKYLMSRSSSCRTSSSSGSSKKYGVSGGTTSSPPPTRRQQQQQGALASDTWMQRREDDAVTAAARVVTACLRQLVLRAVQATATMTSLTLLLQQRRTAAQEQDDDDDLTLTVHSGSCQCGAVQFRFQAPRTLYVQDDIQSDGGDDDDGGGAGRMMIQYPKTCIAVKTFVLQHGSANYLKSFQQKPSNFQTAAAAAAHTFCAACGVHMMHALQPDATELYVNVRCLTRGSFVTKPVSSKKQSQSGVEQNKEPAIVSQQQPDISMISSIPESVERIVSPPHVVVADDNIDDDDPLFTVTAASSISKSFSSTGTSDDYYREDRSSNTAELEQATYRLRKALLSSSPDKSRISVPPRRHHRHQTDDSSEADEQSSSESFVALGPKTPMLQVPTAVAAVAIGNGGAKNNYRNPNMMGSFTNLESSPAAASEKEGADKKAVAATLSTTSTSFQEESVSSAPSVEESREQLRRFMSKHVTTSPARK